MNVAVPMFVLPFLFGVWPLLECVIWPRHCHLAEREGAFTCS